MNFVLNIDQFDIDFVKFMDTKKNIIMNGEFTKIVYSDNCVTFNGIYINLCSMDGIYNTLGKSHFIQKIIDLEHALIECYKYRTGKPNIIKIFNETISSQLLTHWRSSSGEQPERYKSFRNTTNNWSSNTLIILKISGIWENNIQLGLTYKFIEM